MIVLDGKKLADEICADLKKRVDKLKIQGVEPCLNIITTVETSQASGTYIKAKTKRVKEIGIETEIILYQNFGYNSLLEMLAKLNKRVPTIFEAPINTEDYALEFLDKFPFVDMDGLGIQNMGNLLTNQNPTYYPCTPRGIMRLLDHYNILVAGKNVTILGRSNIVGRPLSAMMLNRDATVTVCNSHTPSAVLKQHCINADIIVSAVGKPNMVTRDMVSLNAVVIDVGMNCNEQGKLCGDVDFENVAPICSYITPVPKGVGPMTVAMLMENVVNYFEFMV